MQIAFVCVHNSCRSQMAEAVAKKELEGFRVYSAGTEKYPNIKVKALKVLEEKGYSYEGQYPKLLSDIPSRVDILVTMGCNVICPYIDSAVQLDFGLDDPSGKDIEEFRNTLNKIIEKITRIKNLYLKGGLDEVRSY